MIKTHEADLVRPVLGRLNDDGSITAGSVTSSPELKLRALCHVLPTRVVPIIFLPGIMGTRLRVRGRERKSAWFPPENTWEEIVQGLAGLFRNAAARQRLLNPDTTEVDDNGRASPSSDAATLLGDAPGATDAERGKWRGWGQLHADSYKEILHTLEVRLAHMLENGHVVTQDWHEAVMKWQDADKLGAQKDFIALTEADLRRAADAFLPVHAVGYNWLQSNKTSAEHLAREIDRILAYYRSRNKDAEQVVLVTHSMGGLVARACAQLPGMQEKILGVVHGVMPALGAPATYKRIRAGFEGLPQLVLGRNAADCTAVMANSPGALELLPTRQYRAQSGGQSGHWLTVEYNGQKRALGEGDPYADIYLSEMREAWWRLIKEELINPAGRKKLEVSRKGRQVQEKFNIFGSDFDRYAENIEFAAKFHTSIENRYHPCSFVFYAADPEHPAWSEVVWKVGRSKVDGEYLNAALVHDDLNGKVELSIGDGQCDFKIDGPRGLGDGTVSQESGAAPATYAEQIFCHEGKAKGHTSYDHQMAYSSDIAQAVTLYSICKILASDDSVESRVSPAKKTYE
ncbi:MAG: hypothetical protein ROZ37_06310 [Aromatoleum sp.]|jgi:pimeloyl-ACP methyl ester carboxylesterase|uniref:esterase/lipase family protein n=1 Tax=Aromatoleum sp. TaxID=2307007 RepID=UPI002894B674|nr:hypothetical protein [Aromatoleum sp.]MDT3669927.1 hypothetical protein [Aromatoleum sp.]